VAVRCGPTALGITADFAIAGKHLLREFDGQTVGRLDTSMWRAYYNHGPSDLKRALSLLQAEIYRCPPEILSQHSEARAAAMRIRDTRAASGGMTEPDFEHVGDLLNTSWVSLQAAVSQSPLPVSGAR